MLLRSIQVIVSIVCSFLLQGSNPWYFLYFRPFPSPKSVPCLWAKPPISALLELPTSLLRHQHHETSCQPQTLRNPSTVCSHSSKYHTVLVCLVCLSPVWWVLSHGVPVTVQALAEVLAISSLGRLYVLSPLLFSSSSSLYLPPPPTLQAVLPFEGMNSHSDVAWLSPVLSPECRETQTAFFSAIVSRVIGWKSYLFTIPSYMNFPIPPSPSSKGTQNSRTLNLQENESLGWCNLRFP